MVQRPSDSIHLPSPPSSRTGSCTPSPTVPVSASLPVGPAIPAPQTGVIGGQQFGQVPGSVNRPRTLPVRPGPALSAGAVGAPKKVSEVDCYTCRRRRVKCDRQLPHCAKCERTKLECLGYTKPLVWNKGVASRGKMMGKTFPTPPPVRRESKSSVSSASPTAGESSSRASSATSTTPVRAKSAGPATGATALVSRKAANVVIGPAPVNGGSGNRDPSLLALQTRSPRLASPSLSVHLPTAQGTPFADLSPEVRFYLHYFEQRVAADCVLFDNHHDNPYRVLFPQVSTNLALRNAMVAVAARHHSNLTLTASEAPALPYKVLSFRHLADILRLGPSQILTEPTLAVIMLFLFFETLDGGLNTWRVHLAGAQQLISHCAGHQPVSQAASKMLRIFTAHVSLIDIIGRTLSRSPSPLPPVTTPESLAILRQGSDETDTYNFLGCPPSLLETLHYISISPNASPPPFTPAALLQQIDSFSTPHYISTRPSTLPHEPHLPHLVEAYRAAARVYCLETLFPDESTEDTHAALREHLDRIPRRSEVLKGAVWPVFVAGTGAMEEDEREWCRDMLGRLWEVLPQCNIKQAGRVLERLWGKMQAEEEALGEGIKGGEGTRRRGWRGGAWRRLGEEGDWLFI